MSLDGRFFFILCSFVCELTVTFSTRKRFFLFTPWLTVRPLSLSFFLSSFLLRLLHTLTISFWKHATRPSPILDPTWIYSSTSAHNPCRKAKKPTQQRYVSSLITPGPPSSPLQPTSLLPAGVESIKKTPSHLTHFDSFYFPNSDNKQIKTTPNHPFPFPFSSSSYQWPL